jgi:2-polyprenyl-3-methyl-5-hydroxy-6-metoxy-1,4-benzoquinol methylase
VDGWLGRDLLEWAKVRGVRGVCLPTSPQLNISNDSSDQSKPDANANDSRFVDYYARESNSGKARERATGILTSVLRSRRLAGLATTNLTVADVGCNAGTQSRVWLEAGHRVRGLDISRDLVAVAAQRNAEFGERASFEVGTATSLPWPSASFDVVLVPELLEHVSDWESVLREGARVLKPGGSLFLSTTNVLCPVQQEFDLPLYSWYPSSLKRRYERLSTSTRPELVNYASYPALHWFSPYQLGRYMRAIGLSPWDRFDLIDVESKSSAARMAVATVRHVPPLRFLGHVFTPSTLMVGHKSPTV